MHELTEEQVEFIAADIRRRGIFLEGLRENLLDHICCMLEERMGLYSGFAEAYAAILDDFGENNFLEIQDETTYLLTNKYRQPMKKIMFGSGLVAVISLIAGSLFKLQHWPGAGVLLLTGIALLAVFFVPLWFSLRFRESTGKQQKAIHLAGMLSALLLLIPALFKLFHWPYAQIMMGTGFGFFFLVFLPSYLVTGYRNPVTRYATISNSIMLGSCGALLILLSFQQPSQNVNQAFHESAEQIWKMNAEINKDNSVLFEKAKTATAGNTAKSEQLSMAKKTFEETYAIIAGMKNSLFASGENALVIMNTLPGGGDQLEKQIGKVNSILAASAVNKSAGKLRENIPVGLAIIELAEVERDLSYREHIFYQQLLQP